MSIDEIITYATERVGPEFAASIKAMFDLCVIDEDGAMALVESTPAVKEK